jgi:uncharacterized protein with HEPN domain
LRRDPKVLLWDAKDAADAIAAMTSGKTFEQLVGDIVLRSAVERQFEIVGEALARLARVDESTAKLIPNLPRIIAFRNILVHGYAEIDHARVWLVIEKHLPRLRDTLTELLARV